MTAPFETEGYADKSTGANPLVRAAVGAAPSAAPTASAAAFLAAAAAMPRRASGFLGELQRARDVSADDFARLREMCEAALTHSDRALAARTLTTAMHIGRARTDSNEGML